MSFLSSCRHGGWNKAAGGSEPSGSARGLTCRSGTTTTGQRARCSTALLTEPSGSRLNPLIPRDPTTSRSASPDASMSVSPGTPLTACTVTSTPGRPSSAAAFAIASSAAGRAFPYLGRILRNDDRIACPAADRNRMHGQDGQRSVTEGCLAHRLLKSPLSTERTVETDGDPSHFLLFHAGPLGRLGQMTSRLQWQLQVLAPQGLPGSRSVTLVPDSSVSRAASCRAVGLGNLSAPGGRIRLPGRVADVGLPQVTGRSTALSGNPGGEGLGDPGPPGSSEDATSPSAWTAAVTGNPASTRTVAPPVGGNERTADVPGRRLAR